jgi:DnaB-like helicase C terminal domain
MRIEVTILSNLIHDDEYSRQVIPFIKKEYFSDRVESVIAEEMLNFFDEFNKPATKEILKIQVSKRRDIGAKELDDAEKLITGFTATPINFDWLMKESEAFCKQRALYNTIAQSIQIIDGRDKQYSPEAIPSLLSEALSITFDSSVGHNYIEDASERFDFYRRKEEKLPFDIELLNKITDGGLPRKSMTCLLAGCVHPDTKIKIRTKKSDSSWTEQEVSIGEIDSLLKDEYQIEVTSPDGFVPISLFVDKGEWEEYILTLDSGIEVRVNENHLFETDKGWQYAKDLVNSPNELYLTEGDILIQGNVRNTGKVIPIVDIQVDHDNHRYYTNGVSSHNTGVGKSLVMCHFAAANLLHNKNVLYITMEMSEERIAERIDANLLNLGMAELKTVEQKIFNNRIEKLRGKTIGNLIVKEYPTGSAHTGHFRALIEELKSKKNFVPDVIYIDYLNICASQRMKYGAGVNSYTYIKAIAEELRGLSVEYNVPLVTATQANRCLSLDTVVNVEHRGNIEICNLNIGDKIQSHSGYVDVT